MSICLLVLSAAFLVAIVSSGSALVMARLGIGAARQAAASGAHTQIGLEALIVRLEGLEQQVEALRRQPAQVAPDASRAALNLTTRSQALRMYRRGDPPDQIASLLQVPRQEVDLLIKVHRIVISQV